MGLNFPIDAFLNSTVGDDAVLTTLSPNTVTNIRVYFHRDPADAVVTNERFIGSEIYVDGKDSDFQNAKRGDTLEIDGDDNEYEIINVEPQGNGWVRVHLAKG